MRCSVKGCNITCKHPTKSMCWRDFNMCKYHAYEFYPEVYDPSHYKPCSSMTPSSSRWDEICRKMGVE